MEGPSREFTDPERVALIKTLAEKLLRLYQTEDVPPELYAFLWLSDIEKLRKHVETPAALIPELSKRAIRLWLQKGSSGSKPSSRASFGSQPGSVHSSPQSSKAMQHPSTPRQKRELSSPSPSSSSKGPESKRVKTEGVVKKPRSKSAAQLARDRDRVCIVQRIACVDVAHIYPFSLGFSHGPDNLIAALHMYWSAERINSWLSAITERGTKSPHNLICLTPTAHRLHGDAFFAFDVGASHIEEGTEMWLDLKFHWLKRAGPRATVPLSEIPSLDLEMPSDVKMTVHGQEDHSIRSGDVVRVETDDPEQKPLPLQHLIEMQWFLNRVAALSGAAEAVEPERLDSDDDDDDWSLRMPPSESVCDSDDSRSLGDSTLPSEMMPSSQDIRKQKPNDEPRE